MAIIDSYRDINLNELLFKKVSVDQLPYPAVVVKIL